MAIRIGVDVGGTFTDLISYDDESGEVRVEKTPTTPAAPERGVMAAIAACIPYELLRQAEYFLHGTTVGLNALLERKGAVVGLLATEGFRDVLEVRRGDRAEPYNIFWRQPTPLVPRRLRIPVAERMLANGEIHRELDEADIENALKVFASEGVTSVAVAFINSYANPKHELETERLLKSLGFSGQVSLSHRVGGEFREYERTSTTVIDAYVRPIVETYLERLGKHLRSEGFNGDLLITRSGGGAVTFGEAQTSPVETILSGPVAGAEGAAKVARELGLDEVVSADVGGTSFDTCLITEGHPPVMYESKIIDMPVQMPWVDVRSIGTGGGSVAHVDVGGLLRVGPHSAGADPGPASYGRGGTLPTVTDAALLLGMLGEDELAGDIRLDGERAREVFVPLAGKLGLSLEEVAQGVLAISTASMADAIREITVEQGTDPRQASLIAFGGAGPLFATLIASALEIRRMVIPPYAGNFSAWGLLGADLIRTASRTKILKCTADNLKEANQVFEKLFDDLESRTVDRSGVSRIREVALDIRFVGQEHALTVSVESDNGVVIMSPEEIRVAFLSDYERTFGHTIDEDVELVNMRATVRNPLAALSEIRALEEKTSDVVAARSRSAYSFTRGERLPFRILQRSDFAHHPCFEGPAIIVEHTTTTYVDAEYAIEADPSGCLILTDLRKVQ